MLEWSEIVNKRDIDYQRIARDEVGDFLISTVWLGLDHDIFGPKPLIFETMIFDKDFESLYCKRYSTEQAALDGHKLTVEEVAKGNLPQPQ